VVVVATPLAPVCQEGIGLKQYIAPFSIREGIALKPMPTIGVRPVHFARLDDDFAPGGWDQARIRTARRSKRNVEGDIVYGLSSDASEFKDHCKTMPRDVRELRVRAH
jgi:hypothetical protein